MKKEYLFLFAFFLLCSFIVYTEEAGKHHQILPAGSLQWGPGPLPGSKVAVLDGDPASNGLYTMRIITQDGLKIPPHWHPADEHLTVISGTFNLGLGETFDESKTTALNPGDFAMMPAGERHFAWSKGETIVQVHGMGPFKINFVNPADDPAMKKQ